MRACLEPRGSSIFLRYNLDKLISQTGKVT